MLFELLELPSHVVEHVLSCLDKDRRTLLRCRFACRRMNDIIFSKKLDFMWEKMEFYQVANHEGANGSGQEDQDKALSFLDFLHNVAGYIKHLRFRPNFGVPATDLQSLPHLPALKILDLSDNYWLRTPHLQEIAQKCDIIDINLRRCSSLDSSALAVMSNNWTLMASINISKCSRLTDDHGLVSQFHDTLVALKRYNIECCHDITDAAVLRLLNRDGAAERLTVLRLGSLHLTDAPVTSIGTCSNLEFLSLDGCNLTDAALQTLKSLAQLKHLHLNMGYNFTTNGLEDFFRNASFQLQHLRLRKLPVLNDRAMEHVLLRNQGLKSLGVNSCHNITDTGFQHLRGLSQLRLLCISFLKGVTSAIFSFDAGMLPELRFIEWYGNCGVSKAEVDELRRKFPHAVSDKAQFENVEGRCCIGPS